MYNEHFVFKNTGYFESRSNEVSIRSSGLQARYGIFRYIDLRGGLGISSTRIDVNYVETDSPAPSTAIGYSDTYPIGTHLRVGLSATKTFNSFGFAVELSHEESAVGMSHSVSSNSLNFIIRYFYNRFRIEQPDQLDDSNTPRQNEAHPFNLSPHF